MENENTISQAQTKITIAKYKRCSTDKQELTLQNEVLDKTIKRLIEDNPNIVYEILDFSDFAVSGKNINRPDFEKMMKLIEQKKINIVMFTKLDRLARSLQDMLNTFSIMQNKGIKVIVAEQNIDTSTPQGKLLFQVMGAFAEFERTLIRERLEGGRAKAELIGSKSGKPCHRPKVNIDEDGVKFKYKQGMSMHQIAKFYNVSITPIRRIILNDKK